MRSLSERDITLWEKYVVQRSQYSSLRPLISNNHISQTLQDAANGIRTGMSDWPETVKNIVSRFYVQLAQPILDMGDGRRICWAIGTVNAIVFLMWKTRRLQPFMNIHFAHNPLSGRSYTMLTSVFRYNFTVTTVSCGV